jgi:peptide/nickel transport system ATP-binding protein
VGALLEVQDLTVDIPLSEGVLHPVRGISFSVERGETVCIVGESGCGKSLTSLAIMGLLPKRADRKASALRIGDLDISTASQREMAHVRGNRMAMIFQEPMTSLNPAYTIGNQLEEALLQHRNVPRQEARERAIYLLEKVGITGAAGRLRQYPHQLSGGLRQRVMIAMALMCGPDLIIADEPTTALDVTIQAQILDLIKTLQDEIGMAVLFITHDMGVVAEVADRVVVMFKGHIVEQGDVETIFHNPQHPYTKALINAVPKLGSMNGKDTPEKFPDVSQTGTFTPEDFAAAGAT